MLTSCYGHNTPTLPHLASKQSELWEWTVAATELWTTELAGDPVSQEKGTKEQRRTRGEACPSLLGAAAAGYTRLEVATTTLHLSAPGPLPNQVGLPNPMQTLRG